MRDGGQGRACFCGCGTIKEAIDAVLMILPPPWASMCRASCWQHMKTPRVLTPNVASNSAIGVSSAAEFLLMPALLIATCNPPSRSTAVAMGGGLLAALQGRGYYLS